MVWCLEHMLQWLIPRYGMESLGIRCIAVVNDLCVHYQPNIHHLRFSTGKREEPQVSAVAQDAIS